MSYINKPTEHQIRERAYELFVKRGSEPGREVEDWLLAEQELTELSGARTSWLGPERSVEEELSASELQSGNAPGPRKKTASA